MKSVRTKLKAIPVIPKAWQLLSLLPREPGEVCDRLRAIAEVRWETVFPQRASYRTAWANDGLQRLGETLRTDLDAFLREAALAELETQILDGQARMPKDAPFSLSHNGDSLLGRLCYSLARTLLPTSVVETGVCYGVTSSYLLQALEVNGRGALQSIDFPPLGKDSNDYVGWLVPRHLRRSWTLRRGTSRRLLGPLLKELGPIDLFVHDSLHTYENMKTEFETAWPALRRGGVLISDDVEGNKAFLQLAQSEDLAFSVVIQEENKDALVGIAVKQQ